MAWLQSMSLLIFQRPELHENLDGQKHAFRRDADLMILVDDQKIPCHSSLLRVTSTVFNDLLCSAKEKNELHISGSTPEAVRPFTKSLTSGLQCLDGMNAQQLEEVLILALKYDVRLLLECMGRKINSEPEKVHQYLPLVFMMDKQMWSNWQWSKPVLTGLKVGPFKCGINERFVYTDYLRNR